MNEEVMIFLLGICIGVLLSIVVNRFLEENSEVEK